MVNFCAVYGCSNRSNRGKDRSYFRLPAIITRPNDEKQALSKARRATWLARIRRADLSSNPSNFVRVCSDHFISGKPSSIYGKDNPDWAPSQKLGYDCNKVKESSQDRYNRAQERVEKRRRSEGAIALMELSKATMEETVDVGVSVEELNCKACQTDITNSQNNRVTTHASYSLPLL
ncbi:uncharacterized protein LOC141882444 isoform X2 [Acropora palmata]|uniref:uncharacterized protein LOC141882444 isoform X2 n=1 Tax=Acropora palmata TaxID=6131 RepID=UPI003DA0098F